MSEMTAIDRMLLRLAEQYGQPKTKNFKAFSEEYRRAFAQVSAEFLDQAVDQVIDTYEYPTWPTVGLIMAAVRKIAGNRMDAETRKEAYAGARADKWVDPGPEARARVQAMTDACVKKLAANQIPKPRFSDFPHVDRKAWEKRFGQR